MHAQILQVALCDQAADGIGHTADAQLQAGTVGDLRNDQVGDLQIHFGSSTGSGHLANGRILAFHDAGDLRNVDAVLHAAKAAGHVLVDLNNDLLGFFAYSAQMRCTGAEVEIAVLVHGGYLEHGHIQRVRALTVVAGQLGITDGGVKGEPLCNGLALNAAHVPAVPGHVCGGVVDLEDRGHPHQDAAAEVDALQLRQTLCKLGIHRHGGVHCPAVVHPVTAFDQCGSLSGGHFFLSIQFRKIHYKPSSPIIT